MTTSLLWDVTSLNDILVLLRCYAAWIGSYLTDVSGAFELIFKSQAVFLNCSTVEGGTDR